MLVVVVEFAQAVVGRSVIKMGRKRIRIKKKAIRYCQKCGERLPDSNWKWCDHCRELLKRENKDELFDPDLETRINLDLDLFDSDE